MRDSDRIAFIGDVHLELGDSALPDFLAFLDRLGERVARIVLLGDLFNIWIGGREIEQAHQRGVVDRLIDLRRRGLVVRYAEGNRDYGIERSYEGLAFDQVGGRTMVEQFAGLRILVAHGDLANTDDRQYRTWRAFSRSAAVWSLVRLLPGRTRVALAERLESRMRKTNVDFKLEFPEAQIRSYAAGLLGAGNDLVVLGHFHVERDLVVETDRGPGRVFVLPEWRESRRHLEVAADGSAGFVDSERDPAV